MKNLHKIFFALACGLLVFASCKEDKLSAYVGGSDVYFTLKRPLSSGTGERYEFWLPVNGTETFFSYSVNPNPADSVSFSFATVDEQYKTGYALMPVVLMGELANEDRDISYKITGTNATEGTDFKVVYSYIPKNGIFGGILFELNRSNLAGKGDDAYFYVDIELTGNDNFTVRYDSIPHNNAKYNTLQMRLWFNDAFTRPAMWMYMEGYYGKFSSKKAGILINEVGVPFSEIFLPEGVYPNLSIMPAYGQLLKRYLQREKAAGRTVYEDYLDENGQPVEMTWGMYV